MLILLFAYRLNLFKQPLSSRSIKIIGEFLGLAYGLVLFTLFPWVNAIGNQIAGFVTALASFLQAEVRPKAKNQPTLDAPKMILHPPRFSTLWQHFQVKASTIRQLIRSGSRLGIADLHSGQGKDFSGHSDHLLGALWGHFLSASLTRLLLTWFRRPFLFKKTNILIILQHFGGTYSLGASAWSF
jgi:hypothetical protein